MFANGQPPRNGRPGGPWAGAARWAATLDRRAWASRAAAVGRRYRAALAPGRGLRSTGLTSPAVLAASFLTTSTLFLAANLYLSRRIDAAYRDFRVEPLAAATREDAARVIGDHLGCSLVKPSEDWPRELGRDFLDKPARLQAVELLDGVVSVDPDDRSETLERLVTGRRDWELLPPALLRVSGSTGGEVMAELGRDQSGLLKRRLEEGDETVRGKGELAAALIGRLVDAVHPKLRAVKRINGVVQWATVLLAAHVVAMMVRRLVLIRRDHPASVARRPSAEDAARARHDLDELAGEPGVGDFDLARRQGRLRILQEEFAAYRQGLDDETYGTFGHLVGLLPSLGFVGTVWGMGEALLKADGLLSGGDRARAIREMTAELGYAFDTTLVALVCGIAAGLALVALRLHEARLDERVARAIKARAIQSRAVPVAPARPVVGESRP